MGFTRYLLVLIICLSSFSHADMTGAGDAAILQQLAVQLKTLKDALDTAKENLEVVDKIKKLEESKAVKSIREDGKAIQDFYADAKKAKRDVERYSGYVDDVREGLDEIEKLQRRMERAGNNPDQRGAAKAYANIFMDLKRLKFLSDAQEKTQKQIAEGTNEEDSVKITATNTMIMSRILLENEERAQKKAANDTAITSDIMSSISYEALATESK